MNKPIEDWMLTAYVFGDLDEDQVAMVEAALACDPQLQSEVDAIRATLQTVGAALQEREPYLLSDDQLNRMRSSLDAAIHEGNSFLPVAAPLHLVAQQRPKSRRGLWMGLTAIAASGLAALVFSPNLIQPQQNISLQLEPERTQPVGTKDISISGGTEMRYTQDSKSKLKTDGEVESNFGVEASRDENTVMFKKQASVEELAKSGDAKDSRFGDRALDRVKEIADLKATEPTPPVPPVSFAADAPIDALAQSDAYRNYSTPQNSPALESDFALPTESKAELAESIVEKENRAAPSGYDYRESQVGQTAGEYGSSYGAGASYGGGPALPASGLAAPGGPVGGAYGASSAPATNAPYGGSYGVGGGGAIAGTGGAYGGGYGSGAAQNGKSLGRGVNVQEVDRQLGVATLEDQVAADGAEAKQHWAYGGQPAKPQGNEVAGTEAYYLYSDIPNDGIIAGNKLSVIDKRISGDRFEVIQETPFKSVSAEQVTTFSIDVDTAAYSKVRQAIMEAGQLPNPNAVRIEEMINYFDYDYAGPTDDKPFAAHFAAAECPWAPQNKLLRIALQAKKPEKAARPVSNIVFLLDVSGSMNEPNKLPLVKKTVGMLARQLGENDRVAIAVYASSEGCVLPSTNGINQGAIMKAIDELQAGGSTAGGKGIQLAYKLANDNFIKGGINRVILCTDGDFNVGLTSDEELVNLVQQNAKQNNVFLTCLGFGMGNYNDSMMEKISNKGNGTYAMIDTELEARRVMVEQLNATLMTVAKDVKIQVEFNPLKIGAYRLIGYEDRKLANKDFNDDTKDAGEIGAGHSVTALYEIVPVGVTPPQVAPQEEPLRYAVTEPVAPKAEIADKAQKMDPTLASELLTVRLRYKKPEESVSSKLEFPLTEEMYTRPVDQDFRWASAIAQFGTLLRRSPNAANLNWTTVQEQANAAANSNPYRLEAVDLMRRAAEMAQPRVAAPQVSK